MVHFGSELCTFRRVHPGKVSFFCDYCDCATGLSLRKILVPKTETFIYNILYVCNFLSFVLDGKKYKAGIFKTHSCLSLIQFASPVHSRTYWSKAVSSFASNLGEVPFGLRVLETH